MAEKRLPKGITIRKDGRYQARYTLNGKRYTIYGKTLKEVEKKLRDAKYEIDHGIYAKPDRITVDSWYQTWVKEYRENVVRETTRISNVKAYKHVLAEIGKMKLQAVRPKHVQRVLNRMKREGYSEGYISHARMVMNMMFNQAFLNGMIVTNPVGRSVLPKVEDEENVHRRALTEAEQKAFLDAACTRKPYYADIFYVGFSTGLRIGEINGLEWGNIDFGKMEIHVGGGTLIKVAGKECYKGQVKTGSSRRTVPLLPEVAKRLKKHKLEQAKLRMMMGDKWEPVKGLEHLVFTTMFGKPLTSLSVGRYINATVNAVNRAEKKRAEQEHREPVLMETFCPHAMRHTFATRALERGIPPKVVQSYLGHTTIDVTMNIYTHVTEELEREEIKKIANQF